MNFTEAQAIHPGAHVTNHGQPFRVEFANITEGGTLYFWMLNSAKDAARKIWAGKGGTLSGEGVDYANGGKWCQVVQIKDGCKIRKA